MNLSVEDNALMRWIVRHTAWPIPRFRGIEVQSPFFRAMGGTVSLKIGGVWRNSFLAHLPEVGKDSGNPAPKLADRWKSGVWLGKSDLTDEHFVRTDDGVGVCAKCTTTSQRTAGQKRTSRQSSRPPQKPRSMTTYPRVVPEVHEQENQDEEANENDDEADHGMEGGDVPKPDTAATSISSRGEKRTETRERVRGKTVGG